MYLFKSILQVIKKLNLETGKENSFKIKQYYFKF